ncbi:DUF5067 domain-containing protein [Agrilactobacillus fermenti]|uniref:DUF5067 domain-containing protein n=1 Tax=Agrilactobacillus fermenti TaxID=2586909 RepID=UPI001E53AA6D|nr:DUF5067 domain-containing protein [Agrilactobacillus fermenti]
MDGRSRSQRNNGSRNRKRSKNNRRPNNKKPNKSPNGLGPTKLVLGILLILFALYIFFESMLAGIGNAISQNGQVSGSAGILTGIFYLASGIVYIVAHKNQGRGGDITGLVLLGTSFLISILTAGSFADLKFWAWLGLTIGLLFYIWHSIALGNKPIFKSAWLWTSVGILALGLIFTGTSSDSQTKIRAHVDTSTALSSKETKSSSATQSTSSKPEKATNKTSGGLAHDPNHWTYKDNVFDAGILTYKFTKSEVMDSISEGEKVLVLYCDITNNSKKEQDPSNIYMVLSAKQKTDTSNVSLSPGMVNTDDTGKNPIQTQEDAIHEKLLPGKTIQGAITYDLKNNNPVTIEFENSDSNVIGTKVVNIQ